MMCCAVKVLADGKGFEVYTQVPTVNERSFQRFSIVPLSLFGSMNENGKMLVRAYSYVSFAGRNTVYILGLTILRNLGSPE